MKRYLLFTWERMNSRGGFNDFVQGFDTLNAAQSCLVDREYSGQIVDMEDDLKTYPVTHFDPHKDCGIKSPDFGDVTIQGNRMWLDDSQGEFSCDYEINYCPTCGEKL